MASSNFRTWVLYSNKTNSYVGEASTQHIIDYSKYESVTLGNENTLITWVPYTYNKEQVYISKYIFLENITLNEANALCEKTGIITINDKSYSLKVMPSSFWLEMPSGTYGATYCYNSSFITSTQNTLVTRELRTKPFVSGNSASENAKSSFIPVLVPVNKEVSISGEDADLGQKISSFGITYSVYDDDSTDVLSVKEELNGELIRNIEDAKRGELYVFNITQGMFSSLEPDKENVLRITVTDGVTIASRVYSFTKMNAEPIINYDGSLGLGFVADIPTIQYSVSDINSTVTITEKLNGKIIYSEDCTTNETRLVNITEDHWLECTDECSLEIIAKNVLGGESSIVITFSKKNDGLEIITNPQIVKVQPTKISLEVDWITDNADGKIYACNNALDENPFWENITDSVNTSDIYNFTNKDKTSDNWAVSVKVIIIKDENSTTEVDVFGIRGTYE